MPRLSILIGVCLIVGGLTYIGTNKQGTVRIDNYDHAAAFCEGEPNSVFMADVADVTLVQEGGAFFVISDGHISDKEVQELRFKALEYCTQLAVNK